MIDQNPTWNRECVVCGHKWSGNETDECPVCVTIEYDRQKAQRATDNGPRSQLIDEARRKGLWLWCSYINIWFSPDELDRCNQEGHSLWSSINWRLRDPLERLAELDTEIRNLVIIRNKSARQMGHSSYLVVSNMDDSLTSGKNPYTTQT